MIAEALHGPMLGGPALASGLGRARVFASLPMTAPVFTAMFAPVFASLSMTAPMSMGASPAAPR